MEIVGDLRQGTGGDKDDQLIDKTDEQERAEQPCWRPDGGRQDRATR